MDLESIRRDISAFADQEEDVIFEPGSGTLVFRRLGNEFECTLVPDPSGGWRIRYGGRELPYRTFLAREVARLDILAERIKTRRPALRGPHGQSAYVMGKAILDRAAGNEEERGPALSILDGLCTSENVGATRVVFVTADAGYGKTALLREYQSLQAQRYLDGASPFLFWHVDLQGRQLVRLSEALMADLGDLRVIGIYMPSILVLVRHGLLKLAIDGFDELAVERGSTEALGALAQLLDSLESEGTIVAASRRTFFSAEEYIAGARLLGERVAPTCEFDRLELSAWGDEESTALLRVSGIPQPEATLARLRTSLGAAAEPVVSTPFLLAQAIKALQEYRVDPEAWFARMAHGSGGLDSMVTAFLTREVEEKWKTREGDPLLTVSQHYELLEAIAEEMWMSQVERLDREVIEILADALFDDWDLPHEIRRSLLEMLSMHVFLVDPYVGREASRTFSHVEYLNFFQGKALGHLISSATSGGYLRPVERFLNAGQLSDTVALHAAAESRRRGVDAAQAIHLALGTLAGTWKASNIQLSAGALIPKLLDAQFPVAPIIVDAGVVYPSMIFEHSVLRDVTFRGGLLVKPMLRAVSWDRVRFEKCRIVQPFFEGSAFRDVVFDACDVAGATLSIDGEERTEYSPSGVKGILHAVGIGLGSDQQGEAPPAPPAPDSAGRQTMKRVLRIFLRTTGLTEELIQLRFGRDHRFVTDDVMPVMERHGLVRPAPWLGRGRPQKRWVLKVSPEEILKSESGTGRFGELWVDLDALER